MIYLLQAVIALCLWILVALASWAGAASLRADLLAAGAGGIEPGRLAIAALILTVEVVLFAVFIQRIWLYLQKRPSEGE